MARREVATAILFLLVAVELVAGDVYLHTPRGSNDRVCERNDARQNGNRLFDSENNAQVRPRAPDAYFLSFSSIASM